MDYGLVAEVYIERVLVLIVTLYFIIRIFNKKTLLNPENAITSKRNFVIKYNKKLDLIARICMIIYILYVIPFGIFPAILDIQYIINEKYITINCKTISNDNIGDMKKIREIKVVDIDNGNKLFLKLNYTPIEENQNYIINYLPHLKIGKIIEKVS